MCQLHSVECVSKIKSILSINFHAINGAVFIQLTHLSYEDKLWDEIIYPFPNFNDATVEFWELISIFIPHLLKYVITYPCWDLS